MATRAAKKQAAESQDPLDQFTAAGWERHVALMLWKRRHENRDMLVKVTPEDIKGFDDCVNYLGVEPMVRVHRPLGRPAEEAMPATATQSARPARPADPPKPYVVVQLTDTAGNMIVPVENNEEDHERAKRAQRLREIRESVPALAREVRAAASQGVYSDSLIQELAESAITLAQAQAQ